MGGTWPPALHNCVICLLDGHITLATLLLLLIHYILLCNTILVVTGLSRAFLKVLNSTGVRDLIKMH